MGEATQGTKARVPELTLGAGSLRPSSCPSAVATGDLSRRGFVRPASVRILTYLGLGLPLAPAVTLALAIAVLLLRRIWSRLRRAHPNRGPAAAAHLESPEARPPDRGPAAAAHLESPEAAHPIAVLLLRRSRGRLRGALAIAGAIPLPRRLSG